MVWPVAALLTVSARHAGAVECHWGDGEAVPQPPGWQNLTCTPPSIIGVGSVSIDLSATTLESDYLDVQGFRYSGRGKAGDRRGNTTVALIAHGADGCTACSGSPLCPKITPAQWSVFLLLHHHPPLSLSLPPPYTHCLCSVEDLSRVVQCLRWCGHARVQEIFRTTRPPNMISFSLSLSLLARLQSAPAARVLNALFKLRSAGGVSECLPSCPPH